MPACNGVYRVVLDYKGWPVLMNQNGIYMYQVYPRFDRDETRVHGEHGAEVRLGEDPRSGMPQGHEDDHWSRQYVVPHERHPNPDNASWGEVAAVYAQHGKAVYKTTREAPKIESGHSGIWTWWPFCSEASSRPRFESVPAVGTLQSAPSRGPAKLRTPRERLRRRA